MTQTPREYLTSGEVAALLHCSTKTVTRWRSEGRFERLGVRVIRTLGGPAGRGHYRYNAEDVADVADLMATSAASGDAA